MPSQLEEAESQLRQVSIEIHVMCGTECHNILVSFQVLLFDLIDERIFYAPFYCYWNGHDHFYTTNIYLQ